MNGLLKLNCENNISFSFLSLVYIMAQSNTTDGGRLMKMEVDYSSNCDEKIPICQALALEGKLNEALEILYSLEKQTRTVSSISTPISCNLMQVE